jgi:hypothetical protein
VAKKIKATIALHAVIACGTSYTDRYLPKGYELAQSNPIVVNLRWIFNTSSAFASNQIMPV